MADLESEVAALRGEVNRLKSLDAIRQTLARYGRGQEWLDASLMDEVFWDDAEIDFGFFKGDWTAYRPVLMEIEAGGDTTFHMMSGEQIEMDGEDAAFVECYGIAGGSRGGSTQIYGGRYIMRFARRDGIWKASACRYLMDWTMKQQSEGASSKISGINQITDRGPHHPWFRRMGASATN